MRMGLYEGKPTRVEPHPVSGRADYFGPLCNRSAILPSLGVCDLLSH